jgi:hypothetical protein
MKLIGLLLLAIAAALAWALFVRPLFERIGWLRPLPCDLDDWRNRVVAWVRSSATVALGKLQVWFGCVLEIALRLSDALAVPGLKEQLESVGLGRSFAVAMIIVGVLTVLARTRKGSMEPL